MIPIHQLVCSFIKLKGMHLDYAIMLNLFHTSCEAPTSLITFLIYYTIILVLVY